LEKEIHSDGLSPLTREAAAALLGKIRDGDKAALAILYDRTSPLVFGLVLRILGNRALAEETLLDVYTHIWKQAASYDSRLLPLEWMTAVARTRAVAKMHWSKQDPKMRTLPGRDAHSPMTVAPGQQTVARDAMETLAPTQREIIDWIYYSGLSCNEIAAQAGKPIGAIKTHARLGLSKLSDALRPLFEGGEEATGGSH